MPRFAIPVSEEAHSGPRYAPSSLSSGVKSSMVYVRIIMCMHTAVSAEFVPPHSGFRASSGPLLPSVNGMRSERARGSAGEPRTNVRVAILIEFRIGLLQLNVRFDDFVHNCC